MANQFSKKSLKICHVTSAHSRYDVRIFHKECQSLANNGFDVTLLVNDNLPDENINGVEIVSTCLQPHNRFERMFTSKKMLKQKMMQIDAEVYHFHDPELLPEAAWMKKKDKKVIFDFHEDVSQQILFKTWIPKKIRRVVSELYIQYEKKKASKFDALITVTPKFVERLKKINSNTIMITNYPIIEKKRINYGAYKKRAICFAGGIGPQWNHEYIIKAIESIEDIEYILAGSSSPEYLNKLKGLEGWSKVRYLGKIPHEQVKDIYGESMIGVTLLSNNTQVGDVGTLGNTKIFEFMAAGLPVICSNNKIWKSIVEEYDCGIAIKPDDLMKISTTIASLIEDVHGNVRRGKNARIAIEKKFNWTIQKHKLINLYNNLDKI